ncbi:hypothetical protein EDC22_101576 [Tepidamorphus gemmatus]|uniref:Uncharacterized protein n=1 Tax=Tepidamorphus gemmatus TaxID=747076 RepID=A0A4R3MI23_9HYPH|nr:hypothetical protein [Tepidamorphus gemmatus]TCT13705.1 hypothetical protein EDC22_101576 [Tepidamorphus gemmatus]
MLDEEARRTGGLAGYLADHPDTPHSGNAGSAMDIGIPVTMWDALARLETAAILPGFLRSDCPRIHAAVKRADFDAFMAEAFPREFEWHLQGKSPTAPGIAVIPFGCILVAATSVSREGTAGSASQILR